MENGKLRGNGAEGAEEAEDHLGITVLEDGETSIGPNFEPLPPQKTFNIIFSTWGTLEHVYVILLCM